jgi:hypothetical protein
MNNSESSGSVTTTVPFTDRAEQPNNKASRFALTILLEP